MNKNESVVFSVRWPKWLFDRVNSYCQKNERARNWMIKKTMSAAVGEPAKISDSPNEKDDV